jgi:hypothetical protein
MSLSKSPLLPFHIGDDRTKSRDQSQSIHVIFVIAIAIITLIKQF